jgi:DNA-directed RNA polymerase subunit RPC12/RpoP
MICKTCGKEFETEDKRVKNCDNCRKKNVITDQEKTFDELVEHIRQNSDELQKRLNRAKRRLFIKMIVHYIVHILEIGAILTLFIVK